MGGIFIFDEEELAGLNKRQRKALSDAIHRHLRTSPEIRKILRAKTRTLHNRLMKVRPRTRVVTRSKTKMRGRKR
jgi:formaldehyde-activating enzyme involved in methanogenesis